MHKDIKVGIVGVSGYGGGELLRYCAKHPNFQITYVAGESTVGKTLQELYPWVPTEIGALSIDKWDPVIAGCMDLLFLSLPTGQSKKIAEQIPSNVRVVDLGGDHRFFKGWTYGLPEKHGDEIRKSNRVANPGCYPSAVLTAIAPLLSKQLIDSNIKICAASGTSGMGRGTKSDATFADMNEDVSAYGFFSHPHFRELEEALTMFGLKDISLTFVPQYVPMTRGIHAVCFSNGDASTSDCLAAARNYYEGSAFVHVVDKPPHTRYTTGSNLVFVSYIAEQSRRSIVSLGAIDNLGKGAAGQAVQNANLMFGLPETAGLSCPPISI